MKILLLCLRFHVRGRRGALQSIETNLHVAIKIYAILILFCRRKMFLQRFFRYINELSFMLES